MQLTHERGECRAHAGRNRLVAFRFDDPRQFAGVFEPLCRDDPNLGQMPSKRVDQLCALRHQQFARFVMHERRLVLQRAHGRPMDRTQTGHQTIRH
jgi:hypothetical protein